MPLTGRDAWYTGGKSFRAGRASALLRVFHQHEGSCCAVILLATSLECPVGRGQGMQRDLTSQDTWLHHLGPR